ncbi:hypothetical protein HEL17_019660 [Escherichia sp. 14.0985]|uniref:hypothetical protein n=1 Tax=unclassified Escherichia TaxID=2608889 RepID=UPI000CF77AE3|nr:MULTISPECIES: hypothetical protein [unclassified Escherichia]MBB2412237.1 hypothetical protein [Escherichia sp. 14.0985]MBB2430690.1 hypothetical protein [Escherichia sp. 12.2612]MBB2453670.1 hypothetical protein [Escherichia sp. 8.2195]MED9554205.1 hypothetical protein [Escherichia marmotae]
MEIAPPANWQDFERLTLDYAKKQWKDEYAQRHGRQGQAQSGVDIYGTHSISHELIGIQCKKKKHFEVPSKQLTIAEIDVEIDAAKTFSPRLDHFIIATTGPRDADLQGHIRMQNQAGLPFKVSLLFWEDYQEFLNEHVGLMYKYYKEVLEYRSKYSELDHYLLLLSQAFDRPAIKTSFYCENQANDFIKAMADTQNAIATGRLVDRAGRIIDECKVPRSKIKNLTIASQYLQKAREIATKGMAEGVIIQHQNVIEIKSHEVTDELNQLRRQAVELLNNELIKRDLEIVHFC